MSIVKYKLTNNCTTVYTTKISLAVPFDLIEFKKNAEKLVSLIVSNFKYI